MSAYLGLHHRSLNTPGAAFLQFSPKAECCDFHSPELRLRQYTLQRQVWRVRDRVGSSFSQH